MKSILKLVINNDIDYNKNGNASCICLLNSMFTAIISFNIHNGSMRFKLFVMSSNFRDEEGPQEVNYVPKVTVVRE